MPARIFALVVKEFLALLKDKRSRIVLIIPPLIQLIVFGYAATFDLKNVPFAVYNEDSGAASRQMLAAFDGSPSFSQGGANHARERDRAADRWQAGADGDTCRAELQRGPAQRAAGCAAGDRRWPQFEYRDAGDQRCERHRRPLQS